MKIYKLKLFHLSFNKTTPFPTMRHNHDPASSWWKRKEPSDLLKSKHGWQCLYCREIGHWYADCKSYWNDV
jgi:hypothetical protein